jgi:hypothetical protein
MASLADRRIWVTNNDSMQGRCKIEETGKNTSVPIQFFSKRLYHTDCRVIFSKTHTKGNVLVSKSGLSQETATDSWAMAPSDTRNTAIEYKRSVSRNAAMENKYFLLLSSSYDVINTSILQYTCYLQWYGDQTEKKQLFITF